MKKKTRILMLAMAFAPMASFAAEISLGAPYCFVDPYKTLYHTSDLCNGSSRIDGWALSYADVAEIAGCVIHADFAPTVSVKEDNATVKCALSLRTNLWFDRSNGHLEGAGTAQIVKE